MRPLADKIRPKRIEDIVGQEHILGENSAIFNMIKNGYLPNMIFYGKSGTGKTTLAEVISSFTNKKFYKINATNSNVSDIKEVIKDIDSMYATDGILLYIDEVHYFTKKQQQTILPFLESGKITLIASTTENPYFYIFDAILSRSHLFQFKQVSPSEISKALDRAIVYLEEHYNVKINIKQDIKFKISSIVSGDVRKALNFLEVCFFSTKFDKSPVNIDEELFCSVNTENCFSYDKDGDMHYNVLSAFQKSIRGSDVDASIYYLGILVKSNDLVSISRRLLVIASEDVGLAYPQAISIVKSCVDSANMLGFPEARIPLAQAVILLANAPKSNSCILAIDSAVEDISKNGIYDIPNHLKDVHYKGAYSLNDGQKYKYPYDYQNNYIHQSYLPKEIEKRVYYKFGDNKFEKSSLEYWKNIK